MRDNHKGMPEIINTFEKQSQFFGIVRIEVSGIYKTFQFGVTDAGHKALKRVLQLRPFGNMAGVEQRYFFARSYYKIAGGSECRAYFRVEQGKDGKQVEIELPKELLANLIWFAEIKDFSEAAHLPEVREYDFK